MKNIHWLFGLICLFLLCACEGGVTWEQSIANQSDADLTFQFHGLLSTSPADTFEVPAGSSFVLDSYEGEGRLGELPACPMIADSVTVIVSDSGVVLGLDVLDATDWQLTLVEGAEGGGSKRCVFAIGNNDLQ